MTKTRVKPYRHGQPWIDGDQARFSIWLFFLPLADTPFIPVPAYPQAQEGVFRCDLNKEHFSVRIFER
jgi:hypothetical protein